MTQNGSTESDDEKMVLLMSAPIDPYGAIGNDDGEEDTSTFNDDDDDEDEDDTGESSFQANKRPGVAAANLLLSTRISPAMLKRSPSGGEYGTVPTLLEDNVVLVCDANLISWSSKGSFYYAQDAFYNAKVAPQYAITVSPTIYKKILEEVHLSTNVPCGMYFCCQGGDGAHTGEAHKDFVDIQLAWVILSVLFTVMIVLSIVPQE